MAWPLAVLAVPWWAERAGAAPWHAHHIAERYGLLTLIVLGESILAATLAIQKAMDAGHGQGALAGHGAGFADGGRGLLAGAPPAPSPRWSTARGRSGLKRQPGRGLCPSPGVPMIKVRLS